MPATKPDTVAAGPRFLNCSDTAHTPGPWSVDSNDARDEAQAILSDTTGCIVAEAYALDRPGDCEANARLIAAAPELLASLKDAHGHLEHMAKFIADQKLGYSFESLGEDIGNIRDAIAKAEGRQS